MKKHIIHLSFTLPILSLGCIWMKEPVVETKMITPPPLQITAVPPVKADDVTTANARSKAQLLAEEMERDSGR